MLVIWVRRDNFTILIDLVFWNILKERSEWSTVLILSQIGLELIIVLVPCLDTVKIWLGTVKGIHQEAGVV